MALASPRTGHHSLKGLEACGLGVESRRVYAEVWIRPTIGFGPGRELRSGEAIRARDERSSAIVAR
jgi:hypothetical protein